jgi:translation initiation factor 2 beta subunit (eIF-2beta)/eIF-5
MPVGPMYIACKWCKKVQRTLYVSIHDLSFLNNKKKTRKNITESV